MEPYLDPNLFGPPNKEESGILIGSSQNRRKRMISSYSEGDFSSLPPEPQMGNIEYKLKLINPSNQRLEHLITQLKWRLKEGQGEAIYEIGVEDSGIMTGLSEEDLRLSMETLKEMASRLGATVRVLRNKTILQDNGSYKAVAEVLVRRIPEDHSCIDLRICVLGSAEVGKSTLLGVLTQGELDNGRGRARLNIFRHLHEIRSGRTSSISHEILGFDSNGSPVDYSQCSSAEEICDRSSKVINFVDLAGHKKYFRTTLSGLTGYSPHYVSLVISSGSGVNSITQEYIKILLALEVPFFVVVTKIDAVDQHRLSHTLESLSLCLTSLGGKKTPLVIESAGDVITATSTFDNSSPAVPIFPLSSVSGVGLDLLKKFLYLLPLGASLKEREKLEKEHSEFQIDEIFNVPGVGTVVGGLLTRGIIAEGAMLNVGPLEKGEFTSVNVTSIKRNKVRTRCIKATQSAALAIDIPLNILRKGMVLLDPNISVESSRCCLNFQARVCALLSPAELSEGFQCTAHVGNVRQAACITAVTPLQGNVRRKKRRTGSRTLLVNFRFLKHHEYLRPGTRLLFIGGKSKGIGRITKIFEDSFSLV